MKATVSAIVPAYNEEKGISKVLDALLQSSAIDEVICVNDGSEDKTEAICKGKKGLHVVSLKENHGKAYAIAQGIRQAKGDIVFFIDADLQGLDNTLLQDMKVALTDEGYDGVIVHRPNLLERTVFLQLTGERGYFRKDLIEKVKEFEGIGFGLEVYLNKLYKKKKVKSIVGSEVVHEFKYKRRSFSVAFVQDIRAWFQIVKELLRINKS